MKNRIGFFEEYDGKLSYQRLQSFIVLCFFMLITGYQVFHNTVNFELTLLLLVGALAPKLVQKFVENRK